MKIVRLVDIGVLEEDYSSKQYIPTLTIPKKNASATVKVVANFRKFNILLKRHPFPFAKFGNADMIRSMEGSTFA
jgi:hypothetical protein